MSKPTISFLTAGWADIDDRIREGKPPGGVPTVARIWTECLARGYEVHVFIATFLEDGWPAETVELGGVQFHWLDMPCHRIVRWLHKRRLIGFAKIFSVIWQWKMLRSVFRSKVNPDIIYMMRPTFVLVGRIWARRSGAKTVLRQYGTWIYQFWGREKSLLHRLSTLGEWWAMRMPIDLFIMTNDGSMGDKAAEMAAIPADKFRFWINGVDKNLRTSQESQAAARRDLGLSETAPLIMTLGRIAYWKRLDRIIDAMPTIAAADNDAKLMIVGDGVLRGELEQQVKRLKLEDRVLFVGAVSHNEVGHYLNMCDVFVMPNDLTNMCNTLIEALTCGCCVVTRDVGDTTIVAKDGINSIVLSPGEPEQFSEAIVSLLNDRSKRDRLKERAHSWAMENFQTWDERMSMEVDTLNGLLAGNDTIGR